MFFFVEGKRKYVNVINCEQRTSVIRVLILVKAVASCGRYDKVPGHCFPVILH